MAGIGAWGWRASTGSMSEPARHAAALRTGLRRDPALNDLIRYATLVPNSRNTQPWRFAVSGNTIGILPDFLPGDSRCRSRRSSSLRQPRLRRRDPARCRQSHGAARRRRSRGNGRHTLCFLERHASSGSIPRRQSTRADWRKMKTRSAEMLDSLIARVPGFHELYDALTQVVRQRMRQWLFTSA